MNDYMVDAWNSVVNEDDLTFHLGDFSLAKSSEIDDLRNLISRLRGKKILIRGNHDKNPDSFFVNAGFKSIFDSITLGKVLLVHYPLHEAISRKMQFHSQEIDHVLHGHDHRKEIPDLENHYNVAADRHEFLPVALSRAIPERLIESFLLATNELLSGIEQRTEV
jgi:calcineurin-like phosphoesterase family protein